MHKRSRWSAVVLGIGLAVGGPAVPPAAATPTSGEPVFAPAHPVPDLGEPIPVSDVSQPGEQNYIVQYRKRATVSQKDAASRVVGGDLRPLGDDSGFVTALSPRELVALQKDPAVRSVERDAMVSTATTQATDAGLWGLDRIDQANLPLSGTYQYLSTGRGTTVYVIDSGVTDANNDFGSRLTKLYISTFSDGDDHFFHGTHVAGTLAGTTYGVAKEASVVSIRVGDEDGLAPYSYLISALDYIVQTHHKDEPAVVNISMVGGRSKAMNAAVKRAVNDGVTVVVCAGNDNRLASKASPASAPSAVTVAASDSSDARAGFSNHGSSVDLYAPGVAVRSDYYLGGSILADGTSMAAPHVAGVAAMILGRHPTWSPAKVTAMIKGMAVKGHLTGNRAHTANKLLNLQPTISSFSPAGANVAGGQTVTLRGSGLNSATSVTFAGVAGTGIRARSDGSSLTVTVPAHTNGTVSVKVVGEFATSAALTGFRYAATPAIDAVAPAYGLIRGGATVTLTGSGFVNVQQVSFGSKPAKNFVVDSEGRITAVAPKQTRGARDVRVRTAAGTSAKVAGDRFTYGQVPRVTKISRSSGPASGGARVKLYGTDLASVTSVVFGAAPAVILSATSKRLTVTTPAHAGGRVDVTVTGPFGTSPVTGRTRYTYQ